MGTACRKNGVTMVLRPTFLSNDKVKFSIVPSSAPKYPTLLPEGRLILILCLRHSRVSSTHLNPTGVSGRLGSPSLSFLSSSSSFTLGGVRIDNADALFLNAISSLVGARVRDVARAS